MAAGRPPRRLARKPRPLTARQVRKRLEAMQNEIAAVGGAYQLTAGQIRRRLLLLQCQIWAMLDRWPEA
jgi:hypothetical protein